MSAAAVEKRNHMCGWEEMQVLGDRLTDMGQLETSSRHLAPCCANAGSSEERSQFANLILLLCSATYDISHPLIIYPLSTKTRQEGRDTTINLNSTNANLAPKKLAPN